jgi:hypothetical protein
MEAWPCYFALVETVHQGGRRIWQGKTKCFMTVENQRERERERERNGESFNIPLKGMSQ